MTIIVSFLKVSIQKKDAGLTLAFVLLMKSYMGSFYWTVLKTAYIFWGKKINIGHIFGTLFCFPKQSLFRSALFDLGLESASRLLDLLPN